MKSLINEIKAEKKEKESNIYESQRKKIVYLYIR